MGFQLKKIRLAVFERCRGYCEGRCGRSVTFESGRADHFFGRSRVAESVSNVWFLCLACDSEKTVSKPSSVWWLRTFREHCRIHKFRPEFEMAETKIAWLKAKGMAA